MSMTERTDWDETFEEDYDALNEEAEPAGTDGDKANPTAPVVEEEQESDEERLAQLLASMETRRKVLLGILDLCREPKLSEELVWAVDELQAHNQSVFASTTLINLLEQAGGLNHINEDGSPFVAPEAKVEEEPADETVDDEEQETDEEDFEVEFAEVEAPARSFWVATEAGIAAVEADNPKARAAALLDDDAELLPVYREILEALADGPLTKPQVSDIVRAHPLTQDARHQAGYFIDRLERVDAIEWANPWALTEAGRALLANEALYL